jgi:hypothetical protein
MTRKEGAGKGRGSNGCRGAEHGQACTKERTGAVAVRAALESAVQFGRGDEGNLLQQASRNALGTKEVAKPAARCSHKRSHGSPRVAHMMSSRRDAEFMTVKQQCEAKERVYIKTTPTRASIRFPWLRVRISHRRGNRTSQAQPTRQIHHHTLSDTYQKNHKLICSGYLHRLDVCM